MTDRAAQAAAYWGGQAGALLAHRENAVHAMGLPGGGRAALRLHRRGYQSADAIRSELWWCDGLARAGVPVPQPLAHRDGDWLAVLDDGTIVSAVSWVSGAPIGALGRPLDGSAQEQVVLFRDLGALIARMHSATDALILPPWFTRPRWDRDGLVGEAPLWGRFWDHPAATRADRAALCDARDFLRDALRPGAPLTADAGLIHADLLRENVFVNKGSLSIIDFDDSGFGFRGYDLGTAMIQNLAEPAHEPILDALAEGYASLRPTTAATVAVFTLARVLASVGWAMDKVPPESEIHKSHIARAIGWWNSVRRTAL